MLHLLKQAKEVIVMRKYDDCCDGGCEAAGGACC